jgi:dCMP deaminase
MKVAPGFGGLMADWDSRFMLLAQHVAEWSKDRSSKVGAVIVGPDNEVRAIGYNGFPMKVDEDIPARHERPEKYLWMEHAERNAIYFSARVGTPLAGCRMYVSWFPCMDCARAIVQAGITALIAREPDLSDPQWGDEFQRSLQLLNETGVTVRFQES